MGRRWEPPHKSLPTGTRSTSSATSSTSSRRGGKVAIGRQRPVAYPTASEPSPAGSRMSPPGLEALPPTDPAAGGLSMEANADLRLAYAHFLDLARRMEAG